MNFLAFSNLVLQITHAKTYKNRCQYNNVTTATDKYASVCGSDFYESDVINSNFRKD